MCEIINHKNQKPKNNDGYSSYLTLIFDKKQR